MNGVGTQWKAKDTASSVTPNETTSILLYVEDVTKAVLLFFELEYMQT